MGAPLAPSFQHIDTFLHDYFFNEMLPALRGFASNPLCADGGGGTRLGSGLAVGRYILVGRGVCGGIVGCRIHPLGDVHI
mgnify:CR=1 FL=1